MRGHTHTKKADVVLSSSHTPPSSLLSNGFAKRAPAPPQQPWWASLLTPAAAPPTDLPHTPSDAATALLRRLSSAGSGAPTTGDVDVERRDTPRGGSGSGGPPTRPAPPATALTPADVPEGAVAIDLASLVDFGGDAHGFFILLLLAYFIATHLWQLLAIFLLTTAQASYNTTLVTQAGLKAARCRRMLTRVAAAAATQAVLVFTLLPLAGLVPGGWTTYARMAILMPPAVPIDLLTAVWLIVSFDAGVRMFVTAAKAVLLATHPVAPSEQLRKRAATLSALDAAAATARAAWSTGPWVAALAAPRATLLPALAAAFALAFAGGKVVVVARRAKLAAAALAARGAPSWGAPVAADAADAPADVEAPSAARECPICQAPPVDAIRLTRCGHVFCEACIERWFEQERTTCPMCRAACVPPGVAPTAATHAATDVVPQVF